eukprot:1161394-Pelagomonas_calceolata.AAC.8
MEIKKARKRGNFRACQPSSRLDSRAKRCADHYLCFKCPLHVVVGMKGCCSMTGRGGCDVQGAGPLTSQSSPPPGHCLSEPG